MNINLEGHLFLMLSQKMLVTWKAYIYFCKLWSIVTSKNAVLAFDMDMTPYLSNTPVFC